LGDLRAKGRIKKRLGDWGAGRIGDRIILQFCNKSLSLTASQSRRCTERGFTLIELIVVIFIISLTTALIMPNLWGTGERALKSESKRIANTLRYIYDEAAGKKLTYELKIDLSSDSWGFESERESRIFNIKENVMFKDIIVPSLGKVSMGEVIMKFGPAGPEEPIIFHLIKDDLEYTVTFNNMSGRAKIHEGYIL
jgi:prepilin-type N-terminal cleavage/methylation domain-containing protein